MQPQHVFEWLRLSASAATKLCDAIAAEKLEASRPLKLPDGLRLVSGQNFLMVEGSGSLDRVTVNGDKVSIATIKDGLKEPTAVAKVGGTAWVTEGQLSHLFNAKANALLTVSSAKHLPDMNRGSKYYQ